MLIQVHKDDFFTLFGDIQIPPQGGPVWSLETKEPVMVGYVDFEGNYFVSQTFIKQAITEEALRERKNATIH